MKIIKTILCLFLAIVFVLVIVPFFITLGFSPEFKQISDKLPKNASLTMKKENIPKRINVFRQESGKTQSISFEKYVEGVVASEMPSDFQKEALKAQAVAARTYSLAKLLRAKDSGNPSAHPAAPVCDTVHCQVYQTPSQLKKLKGADWMNTGWKKICSAVKETEGQLLYYKGELVQQALFHSSSGGKTENCKDVFATAVPYLVSVESPYEEEASHQKETLTLSLSQFSSKIKAAYPSTNFGTIDQTNVKILSRSTGGRVEKMQIGKSSLEGRQVREVLGLYSTNFTISLRKSSITFISTGSGHGVGMSQYGANGMAKNGSSYKEILSHYYRGTEVY